MKEKELKFEEDTIFFIIREEIIENIIDEFGNQRIKKRISLKVPKQYEEFSLGSIKNPKNEDVINLRWVFPKNIFKSRT